MIQQDSEYTSVSIITEGLVKLYRELPDGSRQITGFLGPGDLLGSIRRKAGAHCTAQSVNNVVCCAFQRKHFMNVLADYPGLCFMLLLAATDEIEAQTDHIVLLGQKQARDRLAAFLILMRYRWNGLNESAPIVQLPMSRIDVADYLGLTVETVSRAFAYLRQKGLVSTPKANVVVLENMPALCRMAGFDELPEKRMSIGL